MRDSRKTDHIQRLFKNRRFLRLWAAQFATMTAVYALTLAGIALVENQTQSSAQAGLVIFSSILPAFLGSMVSGAIVDRLGKVHILRLSHLGRALILLGFWAGAALLPPGPTLGILYLSTAAAALVTQFAAPAEMALLPDIAGSEQLIAANSLFQASLLAGEGLGIVLLGPLLVKLFGPPSVGVLGAALCLLALILVTGLAKTDRTGQPAETSSSHWRTLGRDLQEGWRTIARDRVLIRVTIQVTLAATLLLVLLALLPGLASRSLGLPAENAPLLILPGGIGFALGTIMVNRWEKRLSRPAWITAGMLGVGSSTGLLGLLNAGSGWGGLAVFFLLISGMGLALALVIIPARAVLQEHPPAELRGRVIAAQLALGNAAAVLPLLLGGAMADRWGFGPVMGVAGLLVLGAGAAGWGGIRS